MQKGLLRQLKRSFGIADAEELSQLRSRLPALAASVDGETRQLLEGFSAFVDRIDETYAQYERDLDLRTRSLELSSAELSEVNEKLRHELLDRENALYSLRAVLLTLDGAEGGNAPEGDDIGSLSRRISALVAESEHGRRALSNQKFALDQHAIVSVTDATGHIIYANDRFCSISGFKREELIGQTHRIVNSGRHSAAFFNGMWSQISQGAVWQGEICNRTKEGGLYWVNATIVPLLDASGLPEQYIAIRTDISDRKRMEAQLSEQLQLVEALVESIPLPLYLKDTRGRYLRLNRAFEIFFGVDRKQLIGHTLHDLLLPEDAAQHLARDSELFAEGGNQTYEALIHTQDGLCHETIYRKNLLLRNDGSTIGLLGTIIDITERKRAERELQDAKEAAEAASKAKSEFLANMSHEIRTPMNGVIGMTDLALETALTEEQREYLSIIKSSGESLLTIINDILDFSKIEAGKLQIENISFNLPKAIAETLKTLALRAHEKNLELISEIGPDVPTQVVGDPNRIRQVLLNLVGNAIKFTERGEISLLTELWTLEDNQATVRISVRDTGIGIAEDKQALIFDAFSQEDSSTTRRYGGTGLGLSISRHLVELMGGRMSLESTPGRGSTFRFTLSFEIDAMPPRPLSNVGGLAGRRILVVDDNATNRRVLCGMLATWDIVSESVASGADALVRLSQPSGFDCILLDAQMPIMDGYTLAVTIREQLSNPPPMIMLSSGAMRGDATRCQDSGIVGFFSKPISAEELLGALCRVFEMSGREAQVPPSQLVTRHALRELQHSLDILLVEDHPINQKLALSLLEKWGHKTRLAVNGQEAVDFCQSAVFDVILMDMQMPVMGGIEATRLIRAREREEGRPHTPIIAMTANATRDDEAACLAAGMDDYLAKPIRTRALLDKLLMLGGPDRQDALDLTETPLDTLFPDGSE